MTKEEMSEEKWKKKLTTEEYHVLREKGTEAPFTGELVDNKREGKYVCAGCGSELFLSDAKYDSGSGWPSFWEPKSEENIETKSDGSLGMKRIEVTCKKCGGHLGHVFEDGPKPTGLRYCINSAALHFKDQSDSEKNDVD
jgi:peptide-methionine (R)-S-oxide reductase